MSGDHLTGVLAQFPQAAPLPSVPQPTPLPDFLAKQFPPRALLLSPWLPEKGLTMIAAPRGLGKTHLALNVAFAVASGCAFLRWQAPGPRAVLYVDGEMPAVALQERLARIVREAPASDGAPDRLSMLAADDCEFGLPDLATAEGQAALRPVLEPYDLIVFDNLSTLCRSGRENEAESWAAMQAFLLELRRAGKSVLLIHHTGKGGAQRGTSKREDVLDSQAGRPVHRDIRQGARA
jgi:RecA-family ATPase